MNPSSRRAKTYLKDDEVDNEVDSSTKGKGPEKNYNEEEIVEVATPAVDEAEKEIKQLRAVLNANISACYMKQVCVPFYLTENRLNFANSRGITKRLWMRAQKVSSIYILTIFRGLIDWIEALQDDPKYVKALERRASCNDTLNTWSSLTTAQEGEFLSLRVPTCLTGEIVLGLDYNKLLTLVSSPSQLFEIRRKLEALKPRQEAAQKRETDEMLSKLKGLGNSILGPFYGLLCIQAES